MLSSISPVGEASRAQRWSLTATAHLVGSLLGGAVVGTLAGSFGAAVAAFSGPPTPTVALAVLAVAAVLAWATDRGRVPWRAPSWQRQVDERWLTTYRGWVYGAGFGLQLGAGVLTRVPTAAVHLTWLAAALTASPVAGAAIGAVFGVVRAAPVLGTGRLRDPLALQRVHRRLDELTGRVELVTGAAVAAVGVTAGAMALVHGTGVLG